MVEPRKPSPPISFMISRSKLSLRNAARTRGISSSSSRSGSCQLKVGLSLRGAVAIAVSLSLHKESYSNVMAGGREIIFEFVRVGGSVKVTALDVASGVEVSIVGPASAGEA